MRVLLDTHILLWALGDKMKLPETTLRAIEDTENEVLFSTASNWDTGY